MMTPAISNFVVVPVTGIYISRLAIPLIEFNEDIVERFDVFRMMHELFLIIGQQPLEQEHMEIQDNWQVEDMNGETFVWASGQGGFTRIDGNRSIGGQMVSQAVMTTGTRMIGKFQRRNYREVKIRPVKVVRRCMCPECN